MTPTPMPPTYTHNGPAWPVNFKMPLRAISSLLTAAPLADPVTCAAVAVPEGFLNHPADMLLLNGAGYLTEVVLSPNMPAFYAAVRNAVRDARVYRLYYAVPHDVHPEAVAFLTQNAVPCDGLFTYAAIPGTWTFTPGDQLGLYYPLGRQLFIEEQLAFARLAARSAWFHMVALDRNQPQTPNYRHKPYDTGDVPGRG